MPWFIFRCYICHQRMHKTYSLSSWTLVTFCVRTILVENKKVRLFLAHPLNAVCGVFLIGSLQQRVRNARSSQQLVYQYPSADFLSARLIVFKAGYCEIDGRQHSSVPFYRKRNRSKHHIACDLHADCSLAFMSRGMCHI